MLQAYREHVAERAALGIPPLPLLKKQTEELIGLLQDPPKGEEHALVELITHRVPAGVDDAAQAKAAFLARIAKGTAACALISREKATELLGTMLGGYNVQPLIDLLDDAKVGAMGNPFPGIQRDGFLLLSGQPDAFTNASSRAPFTRLHLIDDVTGLLNPVVYAQEHGYRPWQRNGITFTGNSDQSYIGHKYDANDNTDFVIQWSDNPNSSPWGTDRMKFVFTTQYSAGAAKGAATTEGMEAMRFWPKSNTEVNVGIGDFAPVAVGDPTERLDVLDGRVRLRSLPGSAGEATGTYKVMVVDDARYTEWRTRCGEMGGPIGIRPGHRLRMDDEHRFSQPCINRFRCGKPGLPGQ